MPITLPPISRRRFLARTLATTAGLLASRHAWADETPADPHRVALLSDTHISANREDVNSGTNMYNNLKQVGGQLVALDVRPSSVMINGDCAYLTGRADDYAVLVELLRPMREAGLPIHLAMGNHDHRQRFWEGVEPAGDAPRPMENRHVTIVSLPRANWFILDSLDETNRTPGVLGESQLTWLAEAIDARPDKPALVMMHHNPDQRRRTSGLIDTAKLFEVLEPRPQVKALIFGHTHDWHLEQRSGIHLINLPPVAYVFTQGKPNGWVDVQLSDNGATFQLHAIDTGHRQHGEKLELTWRDDEKTSLRRRPSAAAVRIG